MCRLIRKRESQLIKSMGLKVALRLNREQQMGVPVNANDVMTARHLLFLCVFPGAIYNPSEACGEDYCEVLL